MKKFTNLIIAAACLLFSTLQAASAQNRIVVSTHHVSREVNVGSFAHIRLNGSSDVELSKVQTQVLNGSVSGSGEIRCHPFESIVMIQKRNGNSISYTGNPKHIERNHY